MNFKELRKRKKLTLEQASDYLGVGFQSLCRYENQGRIPKKAILKKMVSLYDCNAKELGEAILDNLKE
ncbi:helix-turn-helix transcriptional regulator [Clostridium perfringens]|uniref:helix-turn-helix domain-containing protein n=1 Tax=Clostridium perfringens TaxID=1502 RepID=UPI0022468F14|nr:helix-turn-helix transcriptional regulator [Clostridium perfringens]MCX0360376.1 helix-turn-helix transcriptional regulator [Clostridium perfringens]MCX0403443.1 helix-turn-helix transcriptional regulator [Clostridium perfringens]